MCSKFWKIVAPVSFDFDRMSFAAVVVDDDDSSFAPLLFTPVVAFDVLLLKDYSEAGTVTA